MDFETLSTFVSEDNVAGTNEEYNQLYLSMQGLAEGEEESVMGILSLVLRSLIIKN